MFVLVVCCLFDRNGCSYFLFVLVLSFVSSFVFVRRFDLCSNPLLLLGNGSIDFDLLDTHEILPFNLQKVKLFAEESTAPKKQKFQSEDLIFGFCLVVGSKLIALLRRGDKVVPVFLTAIGLDL